MEAFRLNMECPPEEAGNESEIILQVRGVSPSTNAFTVQMYFENSRRSGGGEIKKIKIKDGIFDIEFKDEQGTFYYFLKDCMSVYLVFVSLCRAFCCNSAKTCRRNNDQKKRYRQQ